MRILLLAQLAIEHDGQISARPPTHKIGALLALLSYFKGRFFSREVLAEMFWPESEINAGRANLRVTLTGLRHILEPPGIPPSQYIISNRSHISLREDTVETDVHQFRNHILSANQKTVIAEKISFLEKALDYYSGQLLPGFYDDWISLEREHLEDQWIKVHDQLIENYLIVSDVSSAVRMLQKKISTNPYNEDYYIDLIQLLIKLGKNEQAIEQYKRMEKAVTQQLKQNLSSNALSLRKELELTSRNKPGHTISFSEAESSINTAVKPTIQPALDKNERDLFQTFPDLPRSMTRFIGRDYELSWVIDNLTNSTGHPVLVTLTGIGGIGKTRLAIAAASACKQHYNNRVLFVSLSDIEYAERLIPTILQSTVVPRVPGISELEQLKQLFSSEPTLLVLDNVEHLLNEKSQSEFYYCLMDIINQNPSLRILITSRARTGIDGEQILVVPPLALPEEETYDLDQLKNYSAIQIFVDRARETKSDFVLNARNAGAVSAICRFFDGIPLAIELAASWIWALTPQKMLERFQSVTSLQARGGKGVIDRHKMLRSTLESSIQMLKHEDRLKFAALSVFRGGFTLDAATSVLKALKTYTSENLEQDTFSIKNMMDHSLITPVESGDNNARFRMLEPLRELAQEIVETEDLEKDILDRHFKWVLSLCIQAHPHLEIPSSSQWIEILNTEWPNIYAAMNYGMKNSSEYKHSVVQLVSILWRYWYWQGMWTDGRIWLRRALGENIRNTHYKAEAIFGAGWLAYCQGDYIEASCNLERSCQLAKTLCLPSLESQAVSSLGMVDYSQGRYQDGTSKQIAALEIQKSIGDKHGSAITLNFMGLISAARGDAQEAMDHYCNSLAIMRELGDRFRISQILQNLGTVAFALGDNHAAIRWSEESLNLCQELGDRSGRCAALTTLGNIASVQGNYMKAKEYYTDSLTIRRTIGDLAGCSKSLMNLGLNAYFLGQYDIAETLYHESLQISTTISDAKGIADSLTNLGILAYATRNSKLAEDFYQRSITIYKSIQDYNGLASALVNLAGILKESGNQNEAKLNYLQSLKMREELGDRRGISTCLFAIAIIELEDDDLTNAAKHMLEAMNIRSKMGNCPGVAFCIAGLASVAIKSAEFEKAAILIGAVTKVQQQQSLNLNGPDNDIWEQGVRFVKQQLGSDTFKMLLDRSFELSSDDIMEVAASLNALNS